MINKIFSRIVCNWISAPILLKFASVFHGKVTLPICLTMCLKHHWPSTITPFANQTTYVQCTHKKVILVKSLSLILSKLYCTCIINVVARIVLFNNSLKIWNERRYADWFFIIPVFEETANSINKSANDFIGLKTKHWFKTMHRFKLVKFLLIGETTISVYSLPSK